MSNTSLHLAAFPRFSRRVPFQPVVGTGLAEPS